MQMPGGLKMGGGMKKGEALEQFVRPFWLFLNLPR